VENFVILAVVAKLFNNFMELFLGGKNFRDTVKKAYFYNFKSQKLEQNVRIMTK
jgi:hypothetical protein